MPLLRFLIALFALSPLLVCADQPDADRVLCHKGFLQVVSPDAQDVSPEQCRAVANQVLAAWQFDAAHMRWTASSEWEKRPLKLRILSVERMKTEHPGLFGYARGRDLFVVSLAVLDTPTAQGTLAHELGHTQSFRAMGSREEHLPPRYFMEGQANLLGRYYRDHLQVTGRHYDTVKAREIAKITAAEAKIVYTDNSYGASSKEMKQMDIMESMGIFFVEYLRVRYRGGVYDVIPRMGRVFELVGNGETFEKAFQQEFAAPISRVISEIVAFIRRTESDPHERLKGTLYGQFIGT